MSFIFTGLQVAGILVPLLGIFVLLMREPTRSSMYLLMANIGCLIMNNAYLLVMQSDSYDKAITAYSMEIIGNSVFYIFLTLFILSFLGYTKSLLIKIFMAFWGMFDIGMIAMFWSGDSGNFVFTSMEYIKNNELGISLFKIGTGSYYNARYSIVGVALIALLIISNYRLFNSKMQENRNRLAMIVGAEVLVTLSFTLQLILHPSYEIVPVFGSIAVFSIILSIAKGEFFSVTDKGRDWAIEHSDDPFIVVDRLYQLLDSNPAAKSCFDILNRIKTGERLPQDIINLFTTDSPRVEYQEHHYIRGLESIEQNNDVVGYSLLLSDVSEEELLMQELAMERDRADAANQAKSAFLSNMSHEIRTPINAVLGMDEMILRESEEEDILTYADNIQNAGKTLLGLINDILDLSKIEAGKMDIIPVDYNLSSVLGDLVNMIQPRAEGKGLRLVLDIDSTLPMRLHGDEIRLKQIITNILTNAVKYTESGSVTFKASYEKLDDNNINLSISIKDTGIGIKEEDIKKLFSAYERIEEERNRTIEGTGLGMNITKQLLSMMGSGLDVKSVYGEGSDFSFVIKQGVVVWDEIGDFNEAIRSRGASIKRYKESFTAPSGRILVVDDTPMNLTVIQGLLKRTKLVITTAEKGEEAIKLAKEQDFDVIFLDHMMPDMDGVETLGHLRAETNVGVSRTPVICLTANAVSGAKEEYLAAGFTDYLTKPIVSEQLETMLIQYLPKEKVKLSSDGTEQVQSSEKFPIWISELNGVDATVGIRNCGTLDNYIDGLRTISETLSDNISIIETALNQNDLKNYTIKVHAIKSSMRIIGATYISTLAEGLEAAGNAKDLNRIKKDTPELLERLRSLGSKLENAFAKQDKADLPMMDISQLKEAYSNMAELTQMFDYESIKFIIDNISGYQIPSEENEHFEAIKRAVSNLDWDRLRELL